MQIQSAIIHFPLLEIEYFLPEKNRTTRQIESFALYSIHGNFLLIAFFRFNAVN